MLQLTLQEAEEDAIQRAERQSLATIWINPNAIAAICRLREGGTEVYLIGGTVLEVSESPEFLLNLLAATVMH